MIKNLIDTTLAPENEEAVVVRLNEITAFLPFLIGLSPDERKALPKMGKKTLDFVERTIMYTQEHMELKPPYLDIEGQKRDFTLLKQVQRMLAVMEPLCEKLQDTYMLLGAESYAQSRVFYTSVKGAAKSGVGGVDSIYQDLKERYKQQYAPAEKKKPTAVDIAAGPEKPVQLIKDEAK